MPESLEVIAERVENLRLAHEQLRGQQATDRLAATNETNQLRHDLRQVRDIIAADREKADADFAAWVEKKFDPLVKKVAGFIDFQKLAAALWTGIMLLGGFFAGASGWFRPK